MLTREGFLTWLFKKAEEAGWGIADGPSFEAFPGLEDGAADYMQQLMDQPESDEL